MITKFFNSRAEAGRFLAGRLSEYANNPKVVVLALPRGGVPIAYEVARALNAPLDVFLVRKLKVPGYPELAMGATASGGVRILNHVLINYLHIPERIITLVSQREQTELERREKLYRDGRPALDLRERIVIIVDDGMATGSTMRSAIEALRHQQPERIIVAVPVGARDTCESFSRDARTTCVCAMNPEPFDSVGMWYTDYAQTSDEEVRKLLALATLNQEMGVRCLGEH